MVTCLHCSSINVRVNNGNFAHVKPEGEPAAKYTYNKLFFFCERCENQWESTPDSEKDYLDYVWLRNRTEIPVRNMGADGSHGPPAYINAGELMRRGELAKKISSSYKHLLNLAPSEWHKIHQDAL